MPFVITRYALGKHPRVRISKTEYEELKREKEFLLEYTYVEQKFDILIQNYIELEQRLLNIAARNMVQSMFFSEHMQEQRLIIVRTVSNLLSSCRAYIDQTGHHLSNISDTKSDFKEKFEKLTNKKYDDNLEYRTLEKLRNYSQHRGFPVHGVTFGQSLDEDSWAYMVTPYLDLDELKEDKEFNRGIMKELLDQKFKNNKMNLIVFIRRYVGLLSEIHQEIRNHFKQDTLSARKLIVESIESFERRAKETNSVGVAAMSLDTQGVRRKEPVFLTRALIEYLDTIKSRNSEVKNLHRRYVTNKAE